MYDIGASAGTGQFLDSDSYEMVEVPDDVPDSATFGLHVCGDSMEPTLHDGDEVMVDLNDGQSRLRDGIYVLRMDDMLSVKRVAIEPQGKRVSVLSDNPAYPSWRGLEKRTINIVGRVLWFGRALR